MMASKFLSRSIAYDGSPRDVGNMVRDCGLEITLFQPFRDFEGLQSHALKRLIV